MHGSTTTRDALDRGHAQSRTAAKYVSIMSGVFVLGLLLYLFYSAHLQQTHFNGYTVATDPAQAGCASADCLLIRLESDIQNMRSARVGFALIYRFSLSAAAIIVSLATIVLGSVLIFDRVQAIDSSNAQGSGKNWSISASSPFPGLLMVFMGCVTLFFGLLFAGPKAPPISVRDLPVFLADRNPERHAAGDIALVRIGRSVLPANTTGRGIEEFRPLPGMAATKADTEGDTQ